MEKDIELGSVGELKLSFAGGKAVLDGKAVLPGGFSINLVLVEDAQALADMLFSAIEKASPAGAVGIEESVKALVKAAIQGLS